MIIGTSLGFGTAEAQNRFPGSLDIEEQHARVAGTAGPRIPSFLVGGTCDAHWQAPEVGHNLEIHVGVYIPEAGKITCRE